MAIHDAVQGQVTGRDFKIKPSESLSVDRLDAEASVGLEDALAYGGHLLDGAPNGLVGDEEGRFEVDGERILHVGTESVSAEQADGTGGRIGEGDQLHQKRESTGSMHPEYATINLHAEPRPENEGSGHITADTKVLASEAGPERVSVDPLKDKALELDQMRPLLCVQRQAGLAQGVGGGVEGAVEVVEDEREEVRVPENRGCQLDPHVPWIRCVHIFGSMINLPGQKATPSPHHRPLRNRVHHCPNGIRDQRLALLVVRRRPQQHAAAWVEQHAAVGGKGDVLVAGLHLCVVCTVELLLYPMDAVLHIHARRWECIHVCVHTRPLVASADLFNDTHVSRLLSVKDTTPVHVGWIPRHLKNGTT